MKKLFVLFLLVALVPFTVGCGLFGDNDDTTPINITKLTAKATLPAAAAPSLRALVALRSATKFAGFTMSINGIVLTAETEEETAAGWVVTFSKIVTSTEITTANAGVVPLVVSSPAGSKVVDTYINTAAAPVSSGSTAAVSVVLTAVGATPTVTVTTSSGTTVTAPVIAAPSKIVITNTVKGVKPAFTAKFDSNILGTTTITNNTLPSNVVVDVDVRKAGGTYKDAVASDFSFSYDATTFTLTVTLVNKSLTIGQAYEVVIRSIKVDGTDKVAYTTHSFTAAN